MAILSRPQCVIPKAATIHIQWYSFSKFMYILAELLRESTIEFHAAIIPLIFQPWSRCCCLMPCLTGIIGLVDVVWISCASFFHRLIIPKSITERQGVMFNKPSCLVSMRVLNIPFEGCYLFGVKVSLPCRMNTHLNQTVCFCGLVYIPYPPGSLLWSLSNIPGT